MKKTILTALVAVLLSFSLVAQDKTSAINYIYNTLDSGLVTRAHVKSAFRRSVEFADSVKNLKLDKLPILENKAGLSYFKKQFFAKADGTATHVVAAWWGDSVSPLAFSPLAKGLENVLKPENINYPEGIQAALTTTVTSGVYKYAGALAADVNQAVLDGKVSVTSITRSSTTATLTSSVAHRLSVGEYVTVSGATQTEYNGIFQVVSVPTATTLTYTVSGTPASPATGTINVYGGVADFTYLPNAAHIELANAAVLLLDAGQNAGIATFRLFFARDNNSGSALVELLNEAGNTVLSSNTVTLTNSTLDATHYDVTVPDANAKYKVRITATNKVVFLGCYSLYSVGGLLQVNFGIGGCTFTQNCYAANAVVDYIVNTLGVSLIVVQAKEEGLPGSLTTLATKLNRYAFTSKLIIGSLPDLGNQTTQIANNELYRTMSLANGYAYYDGYKAFGSYQKVVDLGWQNDGTHLLDQAYRFVGDNILSELNLTNARNTTLRLGIDQRFTAIANNIFSKISVTSVLPNSSIEVAYALGGANTTHAVLDYIAELRFRQTTGTYTKLLAYTNTGAGIFTQAGTWADWYAGRIFTQNGLASSFDGLSFHGTNINSTIYLTTASQQMTIKTNSGKLVFNTLNGANQFAMDAAGNVGIGTVTPNAKTLLDVVSTTLGVRFCPMTSTQRDAITSPVEGMLIYNLTDHRYEYWNGSAWTPM